MLRSSAARLVQPNADIAPFKGLILIGTTHTINGYTQMNEHVHKSFALKGECVVGCEDEGTHVVKRRIKQTGRKTGEECESDRKTSSMLR